MTKHSKMPGRKRRNQKLGLYSRLQETTRVGNIKLGVAELGTNDDDGHWSKVRRKREQMVQRRHRRRALIGLDRVVETMEVETTLAELRRWRRHRRRAVMAWDGVLEATKVRQYWRI